MTTRTKNVIYSLIIFVIIAGLLSFYYKEYVRRTCPDYWYKDEMPTAYPTEADREAAKNAGQYFTIHGKSVKVKDYDLPWIQQNCAVNHPTIVS